MLKGLALTPPVLGRISIGRVVEREGRRLPEKDDEFTITTQVHGGNGWIPHPLDSELRGAEGRKLRAIPVWLPFNEPDLVLRATYSMFDRRTGRPLCVGDGQTCRRSTSSGMQSLPCPAPEGCDLAASAGCKPYARLHVRIGEEDELGTFAFRTTGFNSIRTLSARLQYFQAVSGGLLSTLPLELRLRGKSTTQSRGMPIYFADLTTRSGMSLPEALVQARELEASRQSAGFDQKGLDAAARAGLALGAFEESEEEGVAVVEEFFPAAENPKASFEPKQERPDLAQKLALRAGRVKQLT
ncbi:MAG: hydrolase or metal-binding protein [Ramlibacter sp.]